MRFVFLFLSAGLGFGQPFIVSMKSLQEQYVSSQANKTLEKAKRACSDQAWEKCRKLIDQSLAQNPRSRQGLLMSGVLAIQDQDYRKAGRVLDVAVEEDPTEPFLLSVAALVHGLLNDYKAAENLAKRSLRRDPLGSRANFVLGLSLIIQNRDFPEAERSFSRSASEVKEARLFLSYLQLRRGQVESATEECRKFLGQPDAGLEACLALLK